MASWLIGVMHVRPVQSRRNWKPLAATLRIFPVDLHRLTINLFCFLIDWLSSSVSFLTLFYCPPEEVGRCLHHIDDEKTPSLDMRCKRLPHSTNLRSRWQISSRSSLTCCATYFEGRHLHHRRGLARRQVDLLARKPRQVSPCTCLILLLLLSQQFYWKNKRPGNMAKGREREALARAQPENSRKQKEDRGGSNNEKEEVKLLGTGPDTKGQD